MQFAIYVALLIVGLSGAFNNQPGAAYPSTHITPSAVMVARPTLSAPSPAPTPEGPEIVMQRVAKQYGISQADILAISSLESDLGSRPVGDSGCSKGFFHINLCANPDAEGVIGSIESEARWVCERLLAYGYEWDRELAIMKYNAPARPNPKYYEAVESRQDDVSDLLVDI